LYLTESDVASVLDPATAVEAIERCFSRMAQGEVELAPRRRLRLAEGSLADMAASDRGLGLAGGKLYAASAEGATFVVCLFDAVTTELVAVLEADQLGRPRRRSSRRASASSAAGARPRRRSRAFGLLCRRSHASSSTAGRGSGFSRSASGRAPSRARATATPRSRTSS